jgi:glutamate synthase (NADPH/NADH) small chain
MAESVLHFLQTPRAEPQKIALDERQTVFKEIYRGMVNEQAQSQSSRCLSCGIPYCGWKCPVHNDIPGWLNLAAKGKLFEAAELCHETNSLPEICGRVCPQDRLCEGACTLNTGFGAVTIGSMEKWIVDNAFAQGWRPDLSHVVASDKKVAIIGAGPAGLACADVLARNGIKAVVFDRYDEIGGLLMFGIPEFKLEKRVVKQRREIFKSMGIEFKLNCEIGKDISFESLLNDYDAVFLGTGAEKPVEGDLPGEDAKGVYKALDYLIGAIRQNNQLSPKGNGLIDLNDQHVVVLGGGDTSMDCVRTAIRQGAASVRCVYRRDEKEMPGSRREVANAKEEGVQFLFEQQPIAIETQNDAVKALKIQHARTGDVSALNADAIIVAFGYRVSAASWLNEFNVQCDKNGKIIVGSTGVKTQQTHHARIFAGGDNVRGADLVVNAVAEGRQAAKDIVASLT